jgi:plastocyanin domain-containing protein
MQDPIFVFLGIVLVAIVLGWFYFRKPQPPTNQRTDVHLEGEFHPAELHARAEIPLHLYIHRLEDEPEDEWFLVPDLGIREPLPPLMTTIVHIKSLRTGRFNMTCSRGKAQGILVVS